MAYTFILSTFVKILQNQHNLCNNFTVIKVTLFWSSLMHRRYKLILQPTRVVTQTDNRVLTYQHCLNSNIPSITQRGTSQYHQLILARCCFQRGLTTNWSLSLAIKSLDKLVISSNDWHVTVKPPRFGRHYPLSPRSKTHSACLDVLNYK